MQRTKWWLLSWLVLCFVSHGINRVSSRGQHQDSGQDQGQASQKGQGHNSGSDPGKCLAHSQNNPNQGGSGDSNQGRGDNSAQSPKKDPSGGRGDSSGWPPNKNSNQVRCNCAEQSPNKKPNQGRGDNSAQRPKKDPSGGRGDSSEQRPNENSNQVNCSERSPNKKPNQGRGDNSARRPNEGRDDCSSNNPHAKGSGKQRPKPGSCKDRCKVSPKRKSDVSKARCCLEVAHSILETGNLDETIEAIDTLEKVLQETEVEETTSLSFNNFITVLHRPRGPFKGLDIYANESEAMSDVTVSNSKVNVRLPEELDVGMNDTIVFCMVNVPDRGILGDPGQLYEHRLVGLSIRGKNISGLQERVNITIKLTTSINDTQNLSCEFYDFSAREFNKSGCETTWHPGQDNVTCSCDHLTYFGVLLVSPQVSSLDGEILTYISLIGCSLSLLTLVITVLLFITNRKVRADVTMKVHISLVIALILLNLHFLLSQTVAALPSTGPCLYVALAVHYSLLASFSWMALEGFHLYLLLVKVFNIYVRRYMLKISMVGWGVPVVIVSLVVIIDRDAYGRVKVDSSDANATVICYIVSGTVKMVTTVGVFCLVFLFNLTMFAVTIRRVVSLRRRKEYGQSDHERTRRDVCTLLGVTILLGITWGLVFFSFGHMNTPGLYLFCILNSLQGFFIFLWFVMSLRKMGRSPLKTSSETRSTTS